MKPIIERLKELGTKQKTNLDKQKKIAENMIRTAEAAKKEAQKK